MSSHRASSLSKSTKHPSLEFETEFISRFVMGRRVFFEIYIKDLSSENFPTRIDFKDLCPEYKDKKLTIHGLKRIENIYKGGILKEISLEASEFGLPSVFSDAANCSCSWPVR